MRSSLFFLTIVMFCSLVLVSPVAAQEDAPQGQLLTVHEDIVYPSMVEKYEKAAVNLANMINKHNVPSIAYTAAMMNDFTYIYFSPVDNLAAVDKAGESWMELQKKMGKEAFDGMMGQFDGSYPSHKNYLVRMRPELSYKPEYGSQIADGLLFRHWDYYHIQPGMESQAEEIAKEWAALNEKLKTVEGYRLYSGGMGVDGPVFVVVQSAKSAADFYAKQEAWMKKAGDAGKALFAKTWKVVRKFESRDGMIRPDLSVLPKEAMKSSK